MLEPEPIVILPPLLTVELTKSLEAGILDFLMLFFAREDDEIVKGLSRPMLDDEEERQVRNLFEWVAKEITDLILFCMARKAKERNNRRRDLDDMVYTECALASFLFS